MGTEPIVESQTGSYRYEAVVRISEAIAACREPEELARTLADEIGKFLQFDHLYFIVFKENSKEIEYHVWGKGPISSWPDLLIEELPLWEAVRSRDPQHTPDWDTEERCHRFVARCSLGEIQGIRHRFPAWKRGPQGRVAR